MIHADITTRLGRAHLADAAAEDVEAIVRFWHESGAAFLDEVGIDRARLGPPENTRARYTRAMEEGRLFAIGLEGRTVGFTLLNCYTPEVNHSHWHIMDAALRGGGLSSALYPYRIRTYFDAAPIERLIHQTRTRNVGVNRMLDKWVPVTETRHVDDPDGVALPGEFHLRYVRRADVARLMARAGEGA
jgi:hypothetical protein